MLPAITKRFFPIVSAFSRQMSVQVQASPFKLALIQLAVTSNKADNLKHARNRVLEASKNGANVVVLPVRCALYIVTKLSTPLIEPFMLLRSASTLLMAQNTFQSMLSPYLMVTQSRLCRPWLRLDRLVPCKCEMSILINYAHH